MSAADPLFLKACVDLAARGRTTCAPNPPVGCVIVKRGAIIGRGYHIEAGTGHAEVNAIADAGGDIKGATVYVSLEPCAFEGRTPACAETLIKHQVKRVVIAAMDPHPQVDGAGADMLRQAGIEVDIHPLPEAEAMVEGFTSRILLKRPFVRIKTASSLDGAVALANGESQWITGTAARLDVHQYRATHRPCRSR